MNDKKKSISNPKIAESSVMELKNMILMLNQKIDKLTGKNIYFIITYLLILLIWFNFFRITRII